MPTGYIAFILHAHLPWVRHPDREGVLEERWLFEAITECYLPLLRMIQGWDRDRIPGRITMSVTPPLAAMLSDDLLQSRYRHFLGRQLELADREADRTAGDHRLSAVVAMYRERLQAAREDYDSCGGNLVGRLADLARAGRIELLASAATHGYLPLIGLSRPLARAQIRTGVDQFVAKFGVRPDGFWLPECGFAPGDDELLAAEGIKYFIMETHGILHASTRPCYGVYAPLYCPSGVAAFGRDTETSHQVWSADEGYPGDHSYREFYRDIGYELDTDYLAPYLPPGPIRTHTGFKYYRITGATDHKDIYDPGQAWSRATEHAGNFVFNRSHQLQHLASVLDRPPLITAPYDAELFGHWWFEGPEWLDQVIRRLPEAGIEPITPGDYLARFPRNQVAEPSMSSWGYRGFNEVWLEGSNDWIYRHLHLAGDRMGRLAAERPGAWGLERRALAQAARELLLASASDWPFIMKSGTVASYARDRVQGHLANFIELYRQLTERRFREDVIARLEQQAPLFPHLDYRVFAHGATEPPAAVASD